MKTILALAAAAAALTAASAANAQECVNGYRTFGNDIVQPCHTAPRGPMVGVILPLPAPPPPLEDEVIITGSIAPGVVAPPPPHPMADDGNGCVNGYRTLGNQVIVLCGWRR